MRQAATEVGLQATIKSVSAADFINFFTDAGARKGIDMFPTSNYPDYADPAGLYNTFAMPGGTQNYDSFSDPAIANDMNQARSTADPNLRASYVAKAGDLIMQQLPWIPLAAPDSLLVTSRQLTGAPDLVRLHGRTLGEHDGTSLTMARFVTRRLGLLLLALIVSSFVVFISLDLAPGDPLATLTGGRTLPPSALAELRRQYHLNDPLLVRYWHYVTGVILHFNLGTSIQYREPVTTLISQRIGVTAELVVYAGLLIVVFGVGLGLLAGLRRGAIDNTVVTIEHHPRRRPVVRGRDRAHLGVRGQTWGGCPRSAPGPGSAERSSI